MSETVAGFHEHETEHAAPAEPPRGWRRLTAPIGIVMVGWGVLLVATHGSLTGGA